MSNSQSKINLTLINILYLEDENEVKEIKV